MSGGAETEDVDRDWRRHSFNVGGLAQNAVLRLKRPAIE